MAAPLGLIWTGWRDTPGLVAVDFIGRLAPDSVASAATSEAASALRFSAENYPMLDPTPGVIAASLIPARGPHRSAAADLSLWLALVAAMMLVVACANVANLLLARSVSRRVGAIPGVERTAMVHFVPLELSGMAIAYDTAGTGTDRASIREGPYVNYSAPGYFETVGTRLSSGRDFTDADATGEPVAIFNERMARVVSPSGNVVGRCMAIGEQLEHGGCTRIVGVVETQRRRYLQEPDVPMVFLPRDRNPDAIPWGGPAMMIRLRPHAGVSAMQIRAAAQSVRDDLPYVSVQPLAKLVERDVLPFRLGATLFSIFGLISVTLAAVGLYGVLAYFVTERTPEIGIRRSLGASVPSVISLVLRQAMVPVTAGLVVGNLVAFGGTRFLASLLFGVTARDPISFVAASALLIAVATIAALVPARRATRIDPAIAMRAE